MCSIFYFEKISVFNYLTDIDKQTIKKLLILFTERAIIMLKMLFFYLTLLE